jgi:HAMP domain-containing protein
MKKWLSVVAGLVVAVVIVGRWMWLNSPMREIERSRDAVAAAKSWHDHTVRYIPGQPPETYEIDTLCPLFQHMIDSTTRIYDGSPLVRDSITYSGHTYVLQGGMYVIPGGTQYQINANAARTMPIIECDVGPIGADQNSLPYKAMLEGTVKRGEDREVEGDSCTDYDVTVPTPHDPQEKEFHFTICIDETDHFPRQIRRMIPGYDHEGVTTYTQWNVMKEPQLPPEIPN